MDQRWRMNNRRLVAIMLLVLGGAACGSGPPVLGREFQSRAVSVCQATLAQKKALGPFPYSDFNPTRPDLSKLPAIGRLEVRTVTIFETWLGQMQALAQPPTGQSAWADVMKALESHVWIIVEQQAAAQRGDGQTFTKDYYEGNKAQDEMERAADAAGVQACADAAGA